LGQINRIEVEHKIDDTRAEVLKSKIIDYGFTTLSNIKIVDVYTIEKDFDESQLIKISKMLQNPVTQEYYLNKPTNFSNFDYALEIGYLPGVTDNVATTVKDSIKDLFNVNFETTEGVYSSQIIFISGIKNKNEIIRIGELIINILIQRMHIKSNEEYVADNGMDKIAPKVKLKEVPNVTDVNLDISDDKLIELGKKGIPNEDGTTRGPLALEFSYMKAIQAHFKKLNRNPTDIELESIAQTWSEHCKHTIFAAEIDEFKEGIYKTFIRDVTNEIRKKKADNDFCISVFKDNSGAIVFDDNYLITDKVETHNSPSALDPFGGAITGIVGVNRDTIGFGLGAKPIINRYGFCFADPRVNKILYKGVNKTQKMLSSRKIMDGVIDGVKVGGNCSGIPTPTGFVCFDERYRGKPLVFVGTIGLIPKESYNRQSWVKEAQSNDYIVMIGGRVGLDGIHGATFSSEAMDAGSPATAVQIGDPITQKKLSDAVVKEARDLGLYNAITDNGAGGLSSSVSEMARDCNGCEVELEKVPLKYPGLDPWQTWISESQERMTLSVSPEKWDAFNDLMKRRGVEATVIGTFTSSGKCTIKHNNKIIMDLDMEFLHNGLPHKVLDIEYPKKEYDEPELDSNSDFNLSLRDMLSRLNICSFEFISMQFDHEVQAGSVVKSLHGKGRVNTDAAVTKPVLDSDKAVITSQGVNPTYSDINTYDMAACAIDMAVRNVIAVGGRLDYLALLDNFCWAESDKKEKLGELLRSAKACRDIALVYDTPFISGKDSMYNSFKGYDKDNNALLISVPPTLLVSSIAIMDDCKKSVTIDLKLSGDLIYVLGDTYDELGASEYLEYIGEKTRNKKYIGNKVPKVDANKNKKLYNALTEAIDKELISASKSVNRGGLVIALAKMGISGQLGVDVSLNNLKGEVSNNHVALYSESQGRIIITIDPKNKDQFEKIMQDNSISFIGIVTDNLFKVSGIDNKEIINLDIKEISKNYKSTLRGY